MEEQVLDFTAVIEQDEDGMYVARVPDIQGCHTQGKTIPEVLERIKEAIEACIEGDQEDVQPMKFVGLQQVRVSRTPVVVE